jgi:cephalosporin hydroxylase
MLDIVQSSRPKTEMYADLLAERAEHRPTIDAFHRVFYASRQTHGMTYFEGVPLLKNPMDLWIYQEIIWDLRPTLIIETGTAYGGSALYFARQVERVGGKGMVLTIDIEPAKHLPRNDHITYLNPFSSIDPNVVRAVRACASTHPRVMVVLDSDHSEAHVRAELEAYADLVTPGQFLVVEDTNINGRPVQVDWHGGPGPGPAVDAWLPSHPEFVPDPMAERYLMTFHTWLRREEE